MTIKDIAKLAGVSVSTVSKVMNHKDTSISQETREKVLKIAKEYNYIPYSSVLSTSTKTFLIGLLFRSSENIQKILGGILETAHKYGYQIILAYSNNNLENEKKAISRLCNNKIDGLLWEMVNENSLDNKKDLDRHKLPYLVFNSCLPTSENINYQNYGYEATRCLIENQHRAIACLLLSGSRTDSFLEGYKKCLFNYQLPLKNDHIFHAANLRSLLHKIGNHAITGVVCSHYTIATQLYIQALLHHYHIPRDFSLVSLQDIDRLESTFPIISSYPISKDIYGQFLCQKIINTIEHKSNDKLNFEEKYVLNNKNTIDLPHQVNSQKILAIGSTNLDIYLKVPQLPTTGSAVLTSQSSLYAGGKATNEAIGAAKLGHQVSIISAIGNQAEADIISDALQKNSVNLEGLKRVNHYSTGKAYIFVNPKGESTITILSGANESLSSEDLIIKEHLFKNVGFSLINTEIPMTAVKTACLLTHKYGGKTILKPSSRNYLDPDILKLTDILILNKTELTQLCPEDTTLETKALSLSQKGPSIIIVTLGEDGCYLLSAEIKEKFPAKTFPSVDHTGAGDAFISALASYLLYGYSLRQSIHIAQYAAGFCITREGVVPALVDKNTLEAYIHQQEPDLLK